VGASSETKIAATPVAQKMTLAGRSGGTRRDAARRSETAQGKGTGGESNSRLRHGDILQVPERSQVMEVSMDWRKVFQKCLQEVACARDNGRRMERVRELLLYPTARTK